MVPPFSFSWKNERKNMMNAPVNFSKRKKKRVMGDRKILSFYTFGKADDLTQIKG